jgi:hypothetical protein
MGLMLAAAMMLPALVLASALMLTAMVRASALMISPAMLAFTGPIGLMLGAAAIGLPSFAREGLRVARHIGLRLALTVRLLALAAEIALFVAVLAVPFARLLLGAIIRVRLPELLLRGGDQAEIVLGMLIIVLRADRIARAQRVACELQVFVDHMGGGAADLNVRPIRLVDSREWILTFAVATAHSLVLTVSHGVLALSTPVLGGGMPPLAHSKPRIDARPHACPGVGRQRLKLRRDAPGL